MTIKFNDTPIEEITPSGKNSLDTRSKFIQRKNYDKKFDYIMKNYNIETSNFLNSRGKDILYGRINFSGDIVNLSDVHIKNFKTNPNLYCINYVVDAFEELQYWCKSYGESEKFKNIFFINLKPKKTFENIHVKYHDHMTKIYDLFIEKLKTSNKISQIKDFDAFIKNFISFVDLTADKTPIVKSSFFISRECDVTDTGLCVEFETTKKDDDEKKIEIFESPEFPDFIKLCFKCGFLVDKECPWRLVFNFNNPAAARYMQKYNINPNSAYSNFNMMQNYDIDNLISYIVIFYNTFVQTYRYFSEVNVVKIEEKYMIGQTKELREQISADQVKQKYENDFWLSLYFYILLVQSKISLSQQEYESVSKTLINIANSISFKESINKLNLVISQHGKNESKKYNFVKY